MADALALILSSRENFGGTLVLIIAFGLFFRPIKITNRRDED